MKFKVGILYFFICILHTSGICQPDLNYKINRAHNLDQDSLILNLLFHGEFSEGTNSITWKPCPGEIISVNAMGYATTKIDTIFNFTSAEIDYSLFILKSYATNEYAFELASNADVPTLGLALFQKEGDSLNLIAFNKMVCQVGYANLFPTLKIVPVGIGFMTLSIEEEDYKEVDLFHTFYSLRPWELGKDVFTISSSKMIEYKENPIIQKASVQVTYPLNESQEYFDLIVTYQLTKHHESKVKKLKEWKKTYQYNGRRWELKY